MTSVGSLGERGVLKRVLAQLRPAQAAAVGPGDDAAVLRVAGELVVTSDTMIEGPDFRLAWHSGYELGWKLAATNLSDVAAMGAMPLGLTVSLACPQTTPVALLEEIARGLDAACEVLANGCGVVGGDLGTAPVLTAAVTGLGEMQGRGPVQRSGARPGDIVAYTGQLGLAGIGLALLFRDSAEAGVAHSRGIEALRAAHPAALAAQLAPVPPIGAGALAAAMGASAMMDVSDGLSLDAARLAEASGVVLAFESELLRAGFSVQHGQRVSIDAMLSGGEDHGLLVCFPADALIPHGFTIIGEVRNAADSAVEHPGGAVLLDGQRIQPQGWDPYAMLLPGSTDEP